jgi:hypothetical protein
MILISHRGNINGRIIEAENNPEYIDDTIRLGYNVEIDIWMINGILFLGHDEPQYKIDISWIDDRAYKLWVHCKNTESIEFLNKFDYDINYFWHQEDTVTLTSKRYIWSYPGKQPIKNSIAVMPELYNDDTNVCIGICSDYIEKYKNEKK